jgi:ferredoxin
VSRGPAPQSTAGRAAATPAEPTPPGEHDDLSPLVRWLAGQPEPREVGLVCAHRTSPVRAGSGTLVVRLAGCAAELSPASYLEIAAVGVAKLSVLASGCPLADRIEATVASTNRLLSAYPGVPELTCTTVQERHLRRAQVYDLYRLPISRRRLLFLAWLDQSWVPDLHADQRARTLAALRQFAGDGATQSVLRGLPAPSAALSASGCTACGVCVRACPTDALRLDIADADGRFELSSSPSQCVDCGRCIGLCPSGVLMRVGQTDWARLVAGTRETVATGSTRRCGHCGGHFAGIDASQYCAPCRFRIENPFGTQQPVFQLHSEVLATPA